MLLRSRALAAIVLVAACVLAGCGGDRSDSGSAGSATPSGAAASGGAANDAATKPSAADRNQPSWVKDANARCREYKQQAIANAKKFQSMKASDPTEIVEQASKAGLPIGRALVADLHKVDVPANVQQRWNTFLEGLDETFDYAVDYSKVIVSGKQASPELKAKIQAAGHKIKPLTDAYPITDCIPTG